MSRPHFPHWGAVLTMVAAMACLSTQDTLSKWLMLSLTPVLIMWARYSLQTALAVAAMVRQRSPSLWRTRQPRLHLLRGVLVVGGSVCGYAALQRIPVAEFTAIYCLVPLTITLVARFALHEPVSRAGWLCVATGLAGALMVARPGGDVDVQGAILALLGVLCYTGFQLLTGHLAKQDSPLTIQLFTSVLGAATFSVLVPFFWPDALGRSELALLAVVALAGAYGQYFMVLAYARAPASIVSPYLYSAIAFSALGGWWMFGHLPDGWAVTGMGLIAAAGLAMGWSRPQGVQT